MVLYDDGSLVDLRWGSGPIVNALTASGLQTVVERFRESGLFTKSRSIPAPQVAMGFTTYRLTFVDGDRSITVSAANVSSDRESRALVALGDGMLEAGTWLPGDAFAADGRLAHPYLARSTIVTSESVPLRPSDWTNWWQSLARISWPLSTPATQLGDPIAVADQPGRALRCGIIDGVAESRIRSALAGMAFDRTGSEFRTTSWIMWLPEPALLRLTLRPLLPHEPAACDAATLPARPTLAAAPRPSLASLLEAGASGWTPASTKPELFVEAFEPGGEEPVAHVSYYSDGTVLFRDPPSPAVGIGARRLSPAGKAAVDKLLANSGLMGASYTEDVAETAPPHGMYTLVRDSVVLNGTDLGLHRRATRIVSLVERLVDPMSWLPAGSWIGDPDTVLPFRPASIRLDIELTAWSARDGVLIPVSNLRWPLPGSMSSFGEVEDPVYYPDNRSGSLSPDAPLAVMRALASAGVVPEGNSTFVRYYLAGDQPETAVILGFFIESAGDWGP